MSSSTRPATRSGSRSPARVSEAPAHPRLVLKRHNRSRNIHACSCTTSPSIRPRPGCRERTSSPRRSPRSPPTRSEVAGTRSTDMVDQPDHRQRLGGDRVAEPRPIVAARAQALRHPVRAAARAPVFGIAESASPRNGPPGPTASRSANSTTTTRSWPRTTRTRATTSRRSSPSPSTSAPAAATCVRGIATGYEIQVDLVKAICLHKHKIDHVAHLGPSAAAGIGTLLRPATETIYQAVGQALHTTTATRQSRKGEISHAGRRTPRRSPARWRSRPWTGRCAAKTSPSPDLRGRGRRDRLAAGRPGRLLHRPAARSRASRSAPSWTPTPRSTRPNTRRRR